jgi:TPR repeat protein
MSTERMDQQFAKLNALSDRLFGEAAEVGGTEAEQLLRSAGIDPEGLKGGLYQRMLERGEKYSKAGLPLPPLLRQALGDLRPAAEHSEPDVTMARTAKLAIARLFEQIRGLPKLLDGGFTPTFVAAYRNREELSARDKLLLDDVTEDLRKRIGDRQRSHE